MDEPGAVSEEAIGRGEGGRRHVNLVAESSCEVNYSGSAGSKCLAMSRSETVTTICISDAGWPLRAACVRLCK